MEWENIYELIKIANSTLSDKFKMMLNGILNISKDAIKDEIVSVKFNGLKPSFSLKSLIEIMQSIKKNIENINPKNKSFCNLAKFYTKILGYREQY